MATLSSIRKQIAALEKKAQDLIKKESAQAIAKAREIITNYGLTAEDLGLSAGRKTRKSPSGSRAQADKQRKAPGAPMYRDLETGKTWTGRGKPPTWIAGLADRTPFLIAVQDESAASAKPTRATRKNAAAPETPVTGGKRESATKRTARKPAKKAASSKRTPAETSARKTPKRKGMAKKANEPAPAAVSDSESSAT